MAQTPSGSSAGVAANTGTTASSLARGKACLRCRKRKMRCDGVKPACAQCVRAHKPEACAYDDGRGKTRTQALREKIARLEEEIALLRDPAFSAANTAQSVFLHDPHAHRRAASASEANRPLKSQSLDSFDLGEFVIENGTGSLGDRPYSGGVRRTQHPFAGSFGFSYSVSRRDRGSGTPESSPSSSLAGSPSPSVMLSAGSMGGTSPYGSFNGNDSPSIVGSPPVGFLPARTLSPAVPNSKLEKQVPDEMRHALLEIFLLHRTQAGFALHAGRLRTFLYQHVSEQGQLVTPPRHPVLENAMCLWASLLARGTALEAHEQTFLSRTKLALSDALNTQAQTTQSSDGGVVPSSPRSRVAPATAVLDAIQASVILSRYFFATSRLHEASYHASAAADLAVQCGLHQVCSAYSLYGSENGLSVSSSALHLSPPTDVIELGERIGVFWQVYILDRLLSVALRRPPCIVDDECVETRIDTPWPEDIDEYENISVDSIHGDCTLRLFFVNQGQSMGSGGFSPLALRVKAAALYSASVRTASNWGLIRLSANAGASSSIEIGQPSSDVSSQMFSTLEVTLARFASMLLPAHQLGAALPAEDRRVHVIVHTLVHAATVQLYLRLARAGDPASLERCIRAARSAAQVARHLTDADYEYLDPVLGSCWSAVASVFNIVEHVQICASSSGSPTSGWLPHDQNAILSAMTRLGAHFPIAARQSSLFQRSLALDVQFQRKINEISTNDDLHVSGIN